MNRREFAKNVLAAAVVCGGAETVRAALPPRKQASKDVRIFRLVPILLTGWAVSKSTHLGRGPLVEKWVGIDWFDMRPGEKVVVWWRKGAHEMWRVSGDPFWNTTGPVPVEGVPVDRTWVMDDDCEGWTLDTVDGREATFNEKWWDRFIEPFNDKIGRGEADPVRVLGKADDVLVHDEYSDEIHVVRGRFRFARPLTAAFRPVDV